MTEVIQVTRNEIIDHLVGSMMEAMLQDDSYLWSVCHSGWEGYRNMTDAELVKEYRFYISEDLNADIEIQLKGESK